MCQNKKNEEIKLPHLILCEGEDAKQFIIRYLDEYLVKHKNEREFDQFQVIDFGGISQLPAALKTLPFLSNYEKVKSVTIIRDAEGDHIGAVQSVKDALERNGFPEPSGVNHIAYDDKLKVSFSLFPNLSENTENGTLEDLFIENLSGNNVENVLNEISAFMNKLKCKKIRDFKYPHKTKLHTYFSVTDDFVSMKIGQAASAQAFNFECQAMNTFKSLLLGMLECEK